MLYPIGWTVWLSLNSSNTALSGRTDFVGLANYARIVANRDFQTALFQTLGIVAASASSKPSSASPVALALHRGSPAPASSAPSSPCR